MNINDHDFILENVKWPAHPARVLITGGSGFVGHWMTAVPDRFSITALNHLQYDYGKWDFANWDYIIHLANVPPTRVINCARRCNARILYSSSGSVVTDDPTNDYTRGKIEAENELELSGVDYRIARMYTFAGGWMKNHFALINYILDAIRGDDIQIRSAKPTVTRSYMYAADMAIWLWSILFSDSDLARLYPVGSEHAVTMDELAREVQRHFSPPPAIYHDPVYLSEPRPYYVPDTRFTRLELGVEEYTSFTSAIRKTVEHYKAEMGYESR